MLFKLKKCIIKYIIKILIKKNCIIIIDFVVSEWLRRVPRHKEMSNSPTHEGFVDLPLDAAAWLLHFKTQNQVRLKKGDVSIFCK